MPDPIITFDTEAPDEDARRNFHYVREEGGDDDFDDDHDDDDDFAKQEAESSAGEAQPLQAAATMARKQRDLADGHTFDTGQRAQKRQKKRCKKNPTTTSNRT